MGTGLMLRTRWLGHGAVPRGARGAAGAVRPRAGGSPAAARAPARVHVRAALRPRHQPALRAGRRRRRPRRRSGAAATSRTTGPGQLVGYPILTDRQLARRGRPRAQRRAARHRHPGDVRRVGRAADRVPGRVGRRRRPEPAQDLRHRRAPRAGPHDARVRPQRGDRHALHARAHRRRAASPTARSPRWPRKASTSRCARSSTSSPGCAAERWGDGSRRAPGRRLAPPARRPVAVLPRARARASRCGWRPGSAAGRRHVGAVDREPQAGVAAAEGRTTAPRCWRSSSTVRDLGLVTVCEEAGCPNLSECWADGTATFMVLGERCTRACGFCLVDTRKPEAPAADEPARVAEAVDRMGLDHAVLTMVARDDLADGGMAHVAACVEAIRARRPGDPDRDADLRRQGRRRVARSCCSPPAPTCSTTTSRPSPGCSGPCARRPATPAACPCWPGPRRPG